jgi:hypothetical protein
MFKVGMLSFSNLFGDGNRSRRKPLKAGICFIVGIRSCSRNVFKVENPF